MLTCDVLIIIITIKIISPQLSTIDQIEIYVEAIISENILIMIIIRKELS